MARLERNNRVTASRAVATALLCASVVIVVALVAPETWAQGFDPGNPPDRIFGGMELVNLVGDILRIVTIAAGVGVIVGLLYTGMRYLMAGDDQEKAEAAKRQLKNVLIGAAIIIGFSVIIATIINIVSGDFFNGGDTDTGPPPIETST